jgi:hypothetical protein
MSMALAAQVDTTDSARIIFSESVNLQQAIAYLWARPPLQANAIRPDPAEASMGGRQRRYLINKSDLDLVFSLQHGLANVYLGRIQPIMSSAPAELPNWVPRNVRDLALQGRLQNGVTRFPVAPPWGNIVVYSNRSGGYLTIQVFQDYPETLDYYLGVTAGDRYQARLLQAVYTQFNRDMKYYVDEHGYTPERARDEIRRINDELFKLVIEGAVAMLSAGAGISAAGSAIRSSSRQVIEAAERTGFARARGLASEAAAETGMAVRESAGAVKPGARRMFTDPFTGEAHAISATAQKPRSLMTAIRADVAEAEGYKAALVRGEIGLQRPTGSNVPGTDFITAVTDRPGSNNVVEIIVTDVKASGVGRAPLASTVVPPAWRVEVLEAVSPSRLQLGHPQLEAAIRRAAQTVPIRRRTLFIDYSPQGQGRITGWP